MESLPKPATALPHFTPVPRLKPRDRGWTAKRQREFIEALADTGSVKSAARAVGLTPTSAYRLRREPKAEEFRKAWEAALDIAVQKIEDIAMERALNGVEQPVFAYGTMIGTRRVYNDQLLMFMLRSRAPHRFATGGAPKALSTADRFTMNRMKKEWRKEWEAERAARDKQEDEEGAARLEELLDTMHERRIANMSPRTRAAWEEYCRCEKEDKENGYSPWTDPEHPHYVPPRAERTLQDMPRPPEGFFPELAEEVEEESGPRARTVKDDGWD